jgi:hypothetical protein
MRDIKLNCRAQVTLSDAQRAEKEQQGFVWDLLLFFEAD